MSKDKLTWVIVMTCFAGILALALAKSDRDSKAIKQAYPVVETEIEISSEEETSPTIIQRLAEYVANPPAPTIGVLKLEVPTTAVEAPIMLPETTAEEIPTEIPETSLAPLILPNTARVSLTAEEENLLVRVASLEAGNQGWQGMALVMNVILNRRQAWGKSITELVYDKGQFSVVGCEKWNNGFTVPESLTALAAVKDGWDGSQGALFFCAPSGRSQWMATTRQYLFTAYGHEFYR